MKVKRRREDFIVREISSFPMGGGKIACYRLEKSGIGTPEALNAIMREWNVSQKDVSYGGLKDRHAITTQTITVYGGPAADINAERFSLKYLGQTGTPFSPQMIEANEFELQLRDLAQDAAERMRERALRPLLCIPNYFDQQRFGSVGSSNEFVAHPWCHGNYERAVYLALADHNSHDNPEEREQKAILRDHWNDWQACKDRLERSNRRSVVTYLVDHPQGFKKASALINRDMRSLYVSAFQSKIWNEIVVRWIRSLVPPEQIATTTTPFGELAFPLEIDENTYNALAEAVIPLPSGRQSKWPPAIRTLLEEVVSEFGLQVHQLRLSFPRDVFFARGMRNVLIRPASVHAEVSKDELGKEDRAKLSLRFRLAAGQYATMLVKGLEALAQA